MTEIDNRSGQNKWLESSRPVARLMLINGTQRHTFFFNLHELVRLKSIIDALLAEKTEEKHEVS